ncbi:SCP2 sterol-binding domain-containing protein [soil metagenome]
MTAAPSPLDSLKPIAGRALEIVLNQLLALDPETRDGLSELDGRRIELQLEAPALALAVRVRGNRLEVGPADADSEPDLGLRATVSGLLGQLPFLRATGAAPVGKLRINGDAELARRMQQLARGFDPDWDAPFARAFGPIVGPQVARVLREGLRQGVQVAKGVASDGAEWLTEESRDVIGRAELDAFHDDVDALRDRAERLLARAARLPEAPGGAGA